MIPRDLAQARHIDLLVAALRLAPDQRGMPVHVFGAMSRDRLIEFILNERDRRTRHFRRMALELAERDNGLRRRFS